MGGSRGGTTDEVLEWDEDGLWVTDEDGGLADGGLGCVTGAVLPAVDGGLGLLPPSRTFLIGFLNEPAVSPFRVDSSAPPKAVECFLLTLESWATLMYAAVGSDVCFARPN